MGRTSTILGVSRRLGAVLLACLAVLLGALPGGSLAPDTAHAAGFACQLSSVDPHSAPVGSETGFSFIVTSSTDVIAWIRVVSPSGNLVITGASSDWLPDVTFNGSSATFSGSPIDPGNPLNVNVTAQVGSFAATSWTVQASNDQTGTGHVNCPGDASVSSTNGTTPPTITDISASAQSTTATITWTTDSLSNSEVDYGTTAGYGSNATDNAYVTSHSMQLTGLSPSTTYHYQVTSVDQSSNSTSSNDGTFTTAAPPSNTGGGTTPITAPKPTNNDKIPPTIAITSAIPKVAATIPTVSGTAADNVSVVKIEYSTDGGHNWLPVDHITKPGSKSTTFSFTPLNLSDGSYTIVARAIDGSGNITATNGNALVIDRLPPIVGGNVITLGPQILRPDAHGVINTLAGVDLKLTLSTVGGATSVNVNAVDAVSNMPTASFALHQKDDSEIWSGLLSFSKPGYYQLVAHALDGAGNVTDRTISSVSVAKPGVVTSSKGPVASALLTAYTVDPDTNTWVVWDGLPHDQANPQRTGKQGTFNLLLPPGTYYLKADAQGYATTNSSSFTITRPTPITAAFRIRKANLLTALLPNWLTFGTQSLMTPNAGSALPSSFTQHGVAGTTLSGFTVQGTNGRTYTPIDWLGKPTVISVMSTWLPETSEQAAALNAVSTNQDVNIVPVGLQDNAARLRAYNAISGQHLTWIADPDSTLSDRLSITELPANYFVDRKGVVQKVVVGVLSPDELLRTLAGL